MSANGAPESFQAAASPSHGVPGPVPWGPRWTKEARKHRDSNSTVRFGMFRYKEDVAVWMLSVRLM